MIHFHGKVALVTGGSRGIGAAIVRAFWQAGAHVLFSYHQNLRAAEQLARSCDPAARTSAGRPGSSRGPAGRERQPGCCTPGRTSAGWAEVVALRADVSRMADARKLVRSAVGRFGRLDILVANAGIWNAQDIPIEKISESEWDRTLDVNLKGVYTVTRFAVDQMKRQRPSRNAPARIICISSTAGQRGESLHAHYAASKGGIISFVKGLSTELAPYHILVNCVAPGWVDTDMARPVMKTPRETAKVLSAIPLGRVATPQEIAGPVLFLASDLATFITGEILNVNGGAVLVG